MFFLLVSELSEYNSTVTQDTIFVDVSRQERMDLYFDITFIKLPCKGTTQRLYAFFSFPTLWPRSDVQVDIVDSTGQEDIVISKDVQKVDVDGEREILLPEARNFFGGIFDSTGIEQPFL